MHVRSCDDSALYKVSLCLGLLKKKESMRLEGLNFTCNSGADSQSTTQIRPIRSKVRKPLSGSCKLKKSGWSHLRMLKQFQTDTRFVETGLKPVPILWCYQSPKRTLLVTCSCAPHEWTAEHYVSSVVWWSASLSAAGHNYRGINVNYAHQSPNPHPHVPSVCAV